MPTAKFSTSMLDTAQRRDLPIHGVSYAARSSPRFECYNIPTPTRAVMDSNNQGSDLGSYQEITTCESCSYRDPKYLRQTITMCRVFVHWDLYRKKEGISRSNPRDCKQSTIL